jgi:hypothetical protein
MMKKTAQPMWILKKKDESMKGQNVCMYVWMDGCIDAWID